MLNNGEILWLIEQERKDRERYRLTKMLKSMSDEELKEYQRKMMGVKNDS